MVFLAAAVAEARAALEGARVVRAGADGAEGLALETRGPAGRACLCVGWEAWGPRWYLAPELPAALGESRFAAAVSRAVRSGWITGLVRPGLERAVAVEVEVRRGRTVRRLALWAFLWPAGRNAVLVDAAAGTVLTAARPGPWRPGMAFAAPVSPGDLLAPQAGTAGAFEARLGSLLAEGAGPEAALVRAFPGLGPVLAREVAFRASAESPPEAGPAALLLALGEVAEAAQTGNFAPRVILGPDGEPQALVAIPLAHLPLERQRPFPSPGAAAHAVFLARRAEAEAAALRGWAARVLRQARGRLVGRLRKLGEELAAHRLASAYREMGEILVARQREVQRGAAEVLLPDPYGPPGALRAIPLDPAIPVAANAERYFKRARRGTRGEAVAGERLASARRELDRVTELEKGLADANTLPALRDVCAAVERLARRGPGMGRIPPPSGPRAVGSGALRRRPAARGSAVARVARCFLSGDGLTILVGRNNAANDELTLHVARPEDVWLHVEGYGGSHVVIRREGRAEVPRRTLMEAAQLAAYYSQARGQRQVPVHHTLRKYVRKPKGARPGLVSITHEKTVFATPDADLVRRLAAAAQGAGDGGLGPVEA